MFFSKRTREEIERLEEMVVDQAFLLKETRTKLRALEEYHNVEFFHGPSTKPHYRKKRPPKKRPVGRPRKKVTSATKK